MLTLNGVYVCVCVEHDLWFIKLQNKLVVLTAQQCSRDMVYWPMLTLCPVQIVLQKLGLQNTSANPFDVMDKAVLLPVVNCNNQGPQPKCFCRIYILLIRDSTSLIVFECLLSDCHRLMSHKYVITTFDHAISLSISAHTRLKPTDLSLLFLQFSQSFSILLVITANF